MDDAGSEGEEEEVNATAEAMNAAAVRARCEAAYGTLARSWGCVWLAGRPSRLYFALINVSMADFTKKPYRLQL